MRVLIHLLGAFVIGYIGVYYGSGVMMALCLMWLLIPVIEFALTLYFSGRVEIRLENDGMATEWGRPIRFRFIAKNPGIIPGAGIWVCLEYGHAYEEKQGRQKVFLRLGARDRQEAAIELESDLVGWIHCRVRSCRIGGPLRLFRLSRKTEQECSSALLPREYPCLIALEEERRQPGEDEAYMTRLRGENPEEVFQVREYRPGDRIRNIHWKLSARAEEWIVRDFVHPGQCRVALLADLSSKKEMGMEGLNETFSVLLSIGLALVRMQESFWLVWRDEGGEGLRRMMIEEEQSLYEGILQIYQAKLFEEKESLWSLYQELYQEEICIGINREGALYCNGKIQKRFTADAIETQLKRIDL